MGPMGGNLCAPPRRLAPIPPVLEKFIGSSPSSEPHQPPRCRPWNLTALFFSQKYSKTHHLTTGGSGGISVQRSDGVFLLETEWLFEGL